jgi:hypothetical protein
MFEPNESSPAKKEYRKRIHIIALIANLLESLYFGLLVLFAG